MESSKENKEPFTLLTYESKEVADTVCAYLLKEFTMTADGKCHVIEREARDYKGELKKDREGNVKVEYAIVLPSHYSTYTTTHQKCRDGARDFMKGYEKGREAAEKRALRPWRALLRTRGRDGIKLVSHPDPVGKAAGLKCKRVGVKVDSWSENRTWYVATWCEDTGKQEWFQCWSEDQVDTLLEREDYLPFPPR